MAFIERRTHRCVASLARTGLAGIGLRADIAVIAGRTIGFARFGAHSGDGVANAGIVALVERGAYDRIGPHTRACLACIRFRARIAVITGRTIGFARIGAHSGDGVANARIVALIERRAYDGIGPGTRAGLAGIGLRASIVVIACRAIGFARIGAHTRHGIADPRVVALVERGAYDRIGPGTRAGLAGIRLRTGIAVITGRTIGFARIGAHSGDGIANARIVALVERGAYDRIGSGARTRLARIRLRTGIAVIACRSVGFVRIGAHTRHGIAGAGIVALIERRAHDGIGSDARPRLTCIRLGTRVAIIAGIAGKCHAGPVRGCSRRNRARVARSRVAGRIATNAIGTKAARAIGGACTTRAVRQTPEKFHAG